MTYKVDDWCGCWLTSCRSIAVWRPQALEHTCFLQKNNVLFPVVIETFILTEPIKAEARCICCASVLMSLSWLRAVLRIHAYTHTHTQKQASSSKNHSVFFLYGTNSKCNRKIPVTGLVQTTMIFLWIKHFQQPKTASPQYLATNGTIIIKQPETATVCIITEHLQGTVGLIWEQLQSKLTLKSVPVG